MKEALITFLGFAIGITINILMKIRLITTAENITKKEALKRMLPIIEISLYFGIVYSVIVAAVS